MVERPPGRALILSLRFVPKNLYSRCMGALAALPLPSSLRPLLIGWFARRYGANIEEAEHGVVDYRSISAFFTRRLKPGMRPIDSDPSVLVSPADGKLLISGPLEKGAALQAKGKTFGIEEFLGHDPATANFVEGSFATVYLSPRDYHRVHCPVDGQITGYLHIPGTLWPVNPAGVAWVDKLFCRNERLITFIDSDHHGQLAVAMVGATVVGKITTAYDTGIVTNRGIRSPLRVSYEEPRPIARGDELGTFHMGSTVVVLSSQAGLWSDVGVNEEVRMGEALLRVEA